MTILIVIKIYDINGEGKSIYVHLVLHIKKNIVTSIYIEKWKWKALKLEDLELSSQSSNLGVKEEKG